MSTHELDRSVATQAHLLSRLLGALLILLLSDGASRLASWPGVVDAIGRIGYGSGDSLARSFGLINLAGMAFTSVPPTSIVGVILWSGHLGHIVAAHVCIL